MRAEISFITRSQGRISWSRSDSKRVVEQLGYTLNDDSIIGRIEFSGRYSEIKTERKRITDALKLGLSPRIEIHFRVLQEQATS